MAKKCKPNEILIERVYEAPVKAVWDAWTDPEQAAKWWGPRGHSIKTHAKDLKVGGFWKYTMYGPNGETWENKTIYHEVVPMKRLVYDHGGGEDRPPLFRVEVDFIALGGKKTKMDMFMILDTEEAAKETKKFIKAAGGNSTWDRLAEYLEHEDTGKEKFVINRSFNVPIEVMYEMWTNPKHFEKWIAPTGMEMKFIRADIKPGGSTFYKMFGHGIEMYGRAEYLEMQKPNRMIYTQQFADKDEKVSRHPMAPTWPETMLTTIELASEGENQTRVTIIWEIHGKYTPEELAAFIKERGGMTQGWTGSFDKLEEYLDNVK